MPAKGNVLVLPAVVTRNEAAACLRMLVQSLPKESAPTVIVDAAALCHFDSSALAVLLECRRQLQAVGRTLAVRSMPARLRDLSALYGIAELLPAE